MTLSRVLPLTLTVLAAASVFQHGSFASEPIPADDCPDCECGCGKAHALRLRAAAGLPIGEGIVAPGGGYGAREASTDTDVLHSDLDLTLDIPNTSISGSNTIRVRSLVNGLTTLTFTLRSQYVITGATINGSTPITNISAPGTNSYARTATLDRAYNAGEEFTIRIPFSGLAVSRGFGSIEFQTQPSNAANPIVATLSEAYFAGTWWPMKDGDFGQPGDNGDKFTMTIAVTAPDTLTIASNGVVQSIVPVAGGNRKTTWVTNYQMSTYLACFGASVYNTWTVPYTYTPDEGGPARTMPVQFFVYPEHDTQANRDAWSYSVQMLATYRPFYGLYPFVNEKYGIYDFPFGGGMEHQTMTGQGTFDESVTAHELGHQWWGDNVTCKTWNHIWLNEGFATYTEAIWEQYKPGSSGVPALHAAMAARRPGNFGDSVYCPDASNMNRIFSGTYTYRKGGWVLHMLRHMVGDQAFFDGLKEYRRRFEGKAATTEDFIAAMSFVSGQNLDNFSQQWVYGIGAPTYAYGWQTTNIAGQNYLRVNVRQTQNTAWPGRGTPGDAYTTPVDLRVDYAGGSQTVKVTPSARTCNFLVPINAPATAVTLDEFNWVLNGGKTEEAYAAGSPKIAAASPAPGAVFASDAGPSNVSVTFSDAVTATAAAFTVTGPTGTVPFTYSQPSTLVRNLAFSSPLASGTYTVRVRSTITNANGALDGDIIGGTLPSGDGVAGGDAVWTFTVSAPPCAADFNNDGGVDGADVEAFFLAWEDSQASADVNQDGGVDGGDVEFFFQRWQAGGC
ncbi:MAG: copper resistance protein CopC [Planctomycetes bacterium]|nr:copper resistance protein CopC [Planctomycetota bacterium]